MASSLPSPMATPSRSASRTIKWATPRPLASSDSDADIDSDALPNYSVTLNKRTEHVPSHRAAPRTDTSVQLEFNTECDVDVTLSGGNIDVLLQSPNKASTMHLTRRQSDGTWNVKMRKAAAATTKTVKPAVIQEEIKPSTLGGFLAVLGRWEWPRSSFIQYLRDIICVLGLFVFLVNFLSGNSNQEEFRKYNYS